MINRETIYHCDPSSDGNFMDLILTLGDYGDQAYFGLKTFGVSVPYTPGTIQLNIARYIEHGVPWVRGNRVAIALFSKRVVCDLWPKVKGCNPDKRTTVEEVMGAHGD